MRLLGRKKSTTPAPPVRRDKVRNLIKLGMEQSDEGDRDIDHPDFTAARKRYTDAHAGCTQAEMDAALDALQRNGYIP